MRSSSLHPLLQPVWTPGWEGEAILSFCRYAALRAVGSPGLSSLGSLSWRLPPAFPRSGETITMELPTKQQSSCYLKAPLLSLNRWLVYLPLGP